MDLQQLKYVIALGQEMNFQRASQRVHVTQPTLSQQLKKLEDEIGIPLFERTSHQVSFTEAGEKFFKCCTDILARLEEGLGEIRDDKGTLQGNLRVAAIPTISPYLMPQVLKEVRRKAPELTIELYEMITPNLIEALKQGKIDIGVISLPVDENSIVTKLIGKEKFLLACAKDDPLGKKKKITFKDLRKERLLILQEGHCFSEQALEFCKKSRKDASVVFQGNSLSSVLNLAAIGEGVTFVPEMAYRKEGNAHLKFIHFSSPCPEREIGIVWRVSTPLSQKHHFVIDLVEKNFKKDVI